jgi:phytoene dehydrogenase-like protein
MAEHFNANDVHKIPSPEELRRGAKMPEATDLAKLAESAEKERLEREQRARAYAQVVAQRWDNGMQRLFKGILTRRDRHRMMFAQAERGDA